ncbi:MAG: gliding motility-associated C-terminal domain-containing protein [Ichthyobacteriaceae bacterium]|nr:gliding motility-associated C-terminal domain-containing protein [Ichthyobacteriaceae bacterium]
MKNFKLLMALFLFATTGLMAQVTPDFPDSYSAEILDVSCYNGNNGSINIDLSPDNVDDILVGWNDIHTKDLVRNDLTAGEYKLTFINGTVYTFTVNQPSSEISFDVTNLSNSTTISTQCGTSNASAKISNITNAQGIYTYSWKDESGTIIGTESSVNNLSIGTYYAIISDSKGCETTLTFNVTEIEDVTMPVLELNVVEAFIDKNGEVVVYATDFIKSKTDNCTDSNDLIETIGASPNVSNNQSIILNCNSDMFVYVAVTDKAGNRTEKKTIVTILDNIAPVISGVKSTYDFYLDNNGQVNLTLLDIGAEVTDNCGVDYQVLSKALFVCSDVGLKKQVTYTAKDASNNISSVNFNVNIYDSIAPVADVKNIIVSLTDVNEFTVTPSMVEKTPSTDNCSGDLTTWFTNNSLNKELNEIVFSCGDTSGDVNYTYNVKDESGNIKKVKFVITVVNNTVPLLVKTKNISVAYTGTDLVVLPEDVIDEIVKDGCITKTLTPNTFGCDKVGQTTEVTLTLTDVDGNSEKFKANVTVTSNLKPIVVTKNIEVELDEFTGKVVVTGKDLDSGSSDGLSCNSEIELVNWKINGEDNQTYTCADIVKGTFTVDISAENSAGQIATSQANIKVIDVTKPVVETKPTTVELTGGVANINISDIIGSVTDNGVSYADGACVSLSVDKLNFTCNDVVDGGVSVNLTATDASGNSTTKEAIVTVLDNENLVVELKKSLTYDYTGTNIVVTPSDALISVNDDCAVVEIYDIATSTKIDYLGCNDIGTKQYEIKIVDRGGNIVSGLIDITIVDKSGTNISVVDFNAELDAESGIVKVTGDDFSSRTFNDCVVAYWKINDKKDITYTCADVLKEKFLVNIDVYDASDNIIKSFTPYLKIVDNTAPVVNVKEDFEVNIGSTGSVTISVNDLDNGTTDNGLTIANGGCFSLSSNIPLTFNCNDVGSVIKVELIATDESGNNSSDFVNITIKDSENPVITPKSDLTFSFISDINITSDLIADITDNGDDTCLDIKVSKSTVTCADIVSVSNKIAVTVTVTDKGGNKVEKVIEITVVDKTAPVIIVSSFSATLNNKGEVEVKGSDFNNETYDNCEGTIFTINDKESITYTCDNIGDNVVEIIAIDKVGNKSIAESVTLTIVDDINPEANVKDFEVYLNNTGVALITADDVVDVANGGLSDNTTCITSEIDIDTFDCSNIGVVPVKLTVVDGSGNSVSEIANVTVLDTISPNVIVKDFELKLKFKGSATLTVNDIDDGSTDNCSIVSRVLSETKFDCNDVGDENIVVTLTVTDKSGNITTSEAKITVVDVVAPVIMNQGDMAITIEADNSGVAKVYPKDFNIGTFDGCLGVETILKIVDVETEVESDYVSYTCTQLGDHIVVIKVYDKSGNMVESKPKTITVIDENAPDISVNGIVKDNSVFYLDDEWGEVTIIADSLFNNTDANFDCYTVDLSRDYFDCDDLGKDIEVDVFLKNGNGDVVSTAKSKVNVLDTIAPVVRVSKSPVAVILDSEGIATVYASKIDRGSYDNCAIVKRTVEPSEFDCSFLGKEDLVVTLTLEDASGNVSKSQATVYVIDNQSPVAVAKNVTIHLDENGQAVLKADDIYVPSTINAEGVEVGSYDNCSIVDWKIEGFDKDATFDCSVITEGKDRGTQTVNLIVKDAGGRTSKAEAVITIIADATPNIVANNIEVELDSVGFANITVEDVSPGVESNCLVKSAYLSDYSFSCDNSGTNNKVLLTVLSKGDVEVSYPFYVKVLGSRVVVETKDVNVYLDEDGGVNISTSTIDAGSHVCGGLAEVALSLDNTFFNCDSLGLRKVILKGSEGGRIAIDTAIVNVLDTISPVVRINPALNTGTKGEYYKKVYLLSTGIGTLSIDKIDGGSFDNCGIDTTKLSTYIFNSAHLGNQVVTYSVIDNSGNTSTQEITVSVLDQEDPTADFVTAVDVVLKNGSAIISAESLQGNVSDNCTAYKDLDFTLSGKTEFNCSDVGDHELLVTVTDESGNSTSGGFSINVTNPNPVIGIDLGRDIDASRCDEVKIPIILANGYKVANIISENETVSVNSDTTFVTLSANVDTEISMEVVNKVGCTDSDVISVRVASCNGNLVIIGDDVNGDIGQDIQIPLTIKPGYKVSSITTNNTSVATIDGLMILLNNVQENTKVFVTVEGGCGCTDTDEVNVIVESCKDDVLVDLGGDLTIVRGDTVKVAVNFEKGYSVDEWIGVDRAVYFNYKNDTISIALDRSTDITVNLVSIYGCTASGALRVMVKADNVLANYALANCVFPNIITPNGDGINDVFFIECLDNMEIAKFEIFNRWGSKVYTDDNYDNNWGEGVKEGTYFYTIELNNHNPITGYINVVTQ